jgi:hypothetical protein
VHPQFMAGCMQKPRNILRVCRSNINKESFMDKTTHRRLLEITGHLEAIAEQLEADSEIPAKYVLNSFHAEEIRNLTVEMNALLTAIEYKSNF